ncbi:GDSL-type esterase/lipase family protein [Argonema antarcticum]|uniref:GDSL-type esterase/lipase family protein n=1 Tax=Argonema antarcticum TaxID=2942763 RepID=UPI00201253A5|nr:GDSL-type esterase/lipase family protein [Argonema antarcticum]MCL1475717.1 GDSL-type esterase/lipase family protein [Argonema antarcticum A004/B2]
MFFQIADRIFNMKNRRLLNFFVLMFCSLLVFTSCGDNLAAVKNLKLGAGKQVIVLGDSIASGYGVGETEAFPSVLSRQLGLPIVNRGVSGDTTAAGLSRLQTDVITAEPWLVIVELGGNDFLQKVPKAQTEQNLRQIVTIIQDKGGIVVLLGINIGLTKDTYQEIYDRIAKDTHSYLISQIFKGILDDSRYRQDDVIHPNPAGHEILATRIAKDLQPLLAKATWPSALAKYKKVT